ncbi:helix-turn-helix domain-containing protein [Thiothrix winogradskyi]|uniref:Helix-turn-helix domain-containing protein n=1 Tax=Thiothrix winogradskyi TaxID=96472 RepID=A0ABY3SY46_9GAMM|nr:helix-turn-helix domain-containing protein [Thiothrix winogradskyi]UJS23645.1 helix-turn-helix domain-containing protein [Thiothrix winogradskyi]
MTETAHSVEERTSSAVQPGDLTAMLVECRAKAGLDREQAAEELHLSSHIIKALEQEDFAHLPEPPYVRGYLRGYSKLADIDAKELIRTYEALRGAKPDEIAHHFAPARPLNKVAQPVMSNSTLKFIGFGALVLLLGLFSMIPGVRDWANHTWSSFSAQTDQTDVQQRPPSAMEAYVAQKEALEREKAAAEQQAQQTATPASSTPAPEPAPEVVATAPSDQTSQNTATPATPTPEAAATSTQDTAAPTNTTATETTTVTPAPATAPVAPAPNTTETPTVATSETPVTPPATPTDTAATPADATTPPIAGEISIKMEFAEEVWMQIKGDDKKTLFESLNTAGNIKEFKATPPLNVKVGNAPGVKIFVNGQPFDLTAHTKGSVARFRVE